MQRPSFAQTYTGAQDRADLEKRVPLSLWAAPHDVTTAVEKQAQLSGQVLRQLLHPTGGATDAHELRQTAACDWHLTELQAHGHLFTLIITRTITTITTATTIITTTTTLTSLNVAGISVVALLMPR